MDGHVVRKGEMRNAYVILVGKPGRRWEDIRMYLTEMREGIGRCELDTSGSGWDQRRALVNTVMNFQFP